MGGCTNCKGKGACDDHKSSMMGSVEEAMEQLYPTRIWGEVDDAVADEPLPAEELAGLAEELATELTAATFVRAGDEDEPCDFIYVLALGRSPCIVAVRDHGVDVPEEWRSLAVGQTINELYLRVVIGQRARLCAVQQVAMELERTRDGYVVHERPRAGVYDAPLLARMQKLVAILPAYELTHVDFGDIAHAPPAFAPGVWTDAYGLGAAKPSIANYLFYPQPTTMVGSTFLPEAS